MSFLGFVQKLGVYICCPSFPGHDCNNEHNRDPGKTPATGMRHYAAVSLSTRYQNALMIEPLFTLRYNSVIKPHNKYIVLRHILIERASDLVIYQWYLRC